MDVLLLENVRGLGQKHSTVKVPDGYANNNLIPKKLAIPAASQQAKVLLSKEKSKQEGTQKKAAGLWEKLNQLGDPILINVQTNKQGNLYQAITERDVFLQIQKTIPNINTREVSIKLSSPGIKELGEYEIIVAVANTDKKIAKIIKIETI